MSLSNVLLTLDREVKEALEAQAKANMRSCRMEMTYILTQAAVASPYYQGPAANTPSPEKNTTTAPLRPEDIV